MNLTQSLWFFKCEASVNHFGNNLKQRGYKKAKVLSFDLSGAEGVRPNPYKLNKLSKVFDKGGEKRQDGSEQQFRPLMFYNFLHLRLPALPCLSTYLFECGLFFGAG